MRRRNGQAEFCRGQDSHSSSELDRESRSRSYLRQVLRDGVDDTMAKNPQADAHSTGTVQQNVGGHCRVGGSGWTVHVHQVEGHQRGDRVAGIIFGYFWLNYSKFLDL